MCDQRAVVVGQQCVDGLLRELRRSSFVHLHTDCRAGERAPDRCAVAVDCPTARIVGRRKAGIAMFDAGETDHSLEERKALRIVFKQRSSIAKEELVHVVFGN